MTIRITTEHGGVRTFDDTHSWTLDVGVEGAVEIHDADNRPVLTLADGAWWSIECDYDVPIEEKYPPDRTAAIEAVLTADRADITDGLVRALYDAAVGRG